MTASNTETASPFSENHVTNGRYSASSSNGRKEKSSDLLSNIMERRQSAPLMPAFMVSAPGKVIVFGEHAVVHGKVFF